VTPETPPPLARQDKASSRRLAAILAADVAGYSRLIGADEDSTLQAIKAIRDELLDPKIAAHNGRLFKTTGDGFLAEFSSVVDALRCATEVQTAIVERNTAVPLENRIEFRIGINAGDVVVEDGDIFGDTVNVAARLEGLAESGGICVSARVQEDAAGKLDLHFDDIGEQKLKNIARPVRVYRARLGGAASRVPPVVTLRKTSSSSLPEEFALQSIMGSTIRAYTVDATLIQAIHNVKTVLVGFGQTQTTSLSTTVTYIFERDDGSHFPIDLTDSPLPFAIRVRVTFLCFKNSRDKENKFSIYNHSDKIWREPFGFPRLVCSCTRPRADLPSRDSDSGATGQCLPLPYHLPRRVASGRIQRRAELADRLTGFGSRRPCLGGRVGGYRCRCRRDLYRRRPAHPGGPASDQDDPDPNHRRRSGAEQIGELARPSGRLCAKIGLFQSSKSVFGQASISARKPIAGESNHALSRKRRC